MNNSNHDERLSLRFRKVSLYSFVLFLVISAVVAIAIVLSGDFDVFELKVLVTTTVIAAASVCALCCSAYAQRIGMVTPAVLGAGLAAVSAALFINGSWAEVDSAGYWQTSITCGIFAIAAAHALALLSVRLRSGHAWLKPVAAVTIFVLASVISVQVWSVFDGDWLDDSAFNAIIVLAILVVLETLVIPILTRVADDEPELKTETLILTRRDDGVYRDAQGRPYAVEALSNTAATGKPNT